MSRLKRASSAACTAGSGAFSLENGPPGMAFIAKKVTADMINTVTMANSTRLIVYFNIGKQPFFCRSCNRQSSIS